MGHVFVVLVLSIINHRLVEKVRNLWRVNGELYSLNAVNTLREGVLLTAMDVALYLHVDDFGVQAACAEAANAVAALLQEASKEAGLPAKRAPVGEVRRFIGLRPRFRPGGWDPLGEKLGAVLVALEGLLQPT